MRVTTLIPTCDVKGGGALFCWPVHLPSPYMSGAVTCCHCILCAVSPPGPHQAIPVDCSRVGQLLGAGEREGKGGTGEGGRDRGGRVGWGREGGIGEGEGQGRAGGMGEVR